MYDIGGLDHRIGRLTEALEAIKLLWSQERADFRGRYYTLRGAIANPKPVQKPYPPIWIGAGGEGMLRLAARHADVWNCPIYGLDPVHDPVALERSVAAAHRLDELCAEIGRDPASIRRLVQISWNGRDPDELIESCAQWLAAGCNEQIIYLHPLDLDPPGAARAAETASRVLPELRRLA
jgi:alkanesulfonate monooxygenase SsuD/methylene tetrahydromethanopterin reductase-like flavin-dependent oxidoreductase (luciferase family)